MTFANEFLFVEGDFGKIGQPHPYTIGPFDLYGLSGKLGTSGLMGVTHGT